MRGNKSIEPGRRTSGDLFFLLAVAVALGVGLALASPALGAGLNSAATQSSGGSISGTVTVTGGSPGGITVELRQRTNGGDDKVLATTTTDGSGNYSFANQATAPNDAFFYVKFTGGKGTLANWYSFPIIYISGSNFTVPSVEMADVQLLLPAGSVISLPQSLQWKARRSGETYRVFVYGQGNTTKAVLDSGSLGMGTEFLLAQGALADGTYEAVVQVRDAVVGYGQSQNQFRFTVGKAQSGGQSQNPGAGLSTGNGSGGGAQQVPPANPGQQPPAAQPTDQAPTAAAPSSPAQPAPPAGSPDLKLNLSADHTQLQQGDKMVYKIEVSNNGSATAPGVVVTDILPAGVTVDSSTAHSTAGSLAVQGNNVTVQLGDLPANSKAVVEIPVSVNNGASSNLSNQASAAYQGAPGTVNSNAYIAQVAAPPAGLPASQPQSQPQQPPASNPQVPSQTQPQQPAQSQPQAPAANEPASQPKAPPKSQPKSQPQAPPKKPAESIPQTGGSFPLVLSTLILAAILLARYLRGRSYRRV
jgi:uncharacterized repeat protein (TIGR01451 family)